MTNKVKVFFAILLLSSAAIAAGVSGKDGNYVFTTSSGSVLEISSSDEALINGKSIGKCKTKTDKFETADGELKCYGGVIKLEDTAGNKLAKYPTYVQANDSSGQSFKFEKK
jgi:uncharacterized cupredoxin-like copper-binding protein